MVDIDPEFVASSAAPKSSMISHSPSFSQSFAGGHGGSIVDRQGTQVRNMKMEEELNQLRELKT